MKIIENRFYVYAHYTKDTNELFYIGKGTDNRAFVKNKRSIFWKNVVKKHGYRIEILIDNLIESDSFIQEILAIREFSPRVNLTKGGEGVSLPCSENNKKALRLYWANMDPIEKSKEQKRRSSFRKPRGILHINTGKCYRTAREAAADLNIKYEQHITRVANGTRKALKGNKFKYIT